MGSYRHRGLDNRALVGAHRYRKEKLEKLPPGLRVGGVEAERPHDLREVLAAGDVPLAGVVVEGGGSSASCAAMYWRTFCGGLCPALSGLPGKRR
jgi:hypothetical protein